MEVWSALRASRQRGMEIWRRVAGIATRRHGGLEARCSCNDVEVWRESSGGSS